MEYKWIAQDKDGFIKKFYSDDAPRICRGMWINHVQWKMEQESLGHNIKGWKNSLINLETHDYEIVGGILVKVEKVNTKRHKHADLIHAWADGAEIECYDDDTGWCVTTSPSFAERHEYRIKTKTKVVRARMHVVGTSVKVEYDYAAIHFHDYKWLGDWQEVEVPIE